MKNLYCKNCEMETEHEDFNGIFICSACGLEYKEKVMAKGKGKGRRLSAEEKEALIEDLKNRNPLEESLGSIAKKHGTALSTTVYYANKLKAGKIKKKKVGMTKKKNIGINRSGDIGLDQPRRWKSGIVEIGKNKMDDELLNIPINQLSGTKTFKDGLMKVLLELSELMIKKQTDYGHTNITDMGVMGLIVRMNDKMARLKNLHGFIDKSYKIKSAQNESIKDTFRDLANYAIIYLMLEDETFTLPLIADVEKDKNI